MKEETFTCADCGNEIPKAKYHGHQRMTLTGLRPICCSCWAGERLGLASQAVWWNPATFRHETIKR